MKPIFSWLALIACLVSCEPGVSEGTQRIDSKSQQTSPLQQKDQNSIDSLSGLKWMSVQQLPSQGKTVYALIRKGGPFKYAKDGTTFGNYERILPKEKRGFYREYTVNTPGLSHRGARRIVCGGMPKTSVKYCYYTSDHYNSFRRIKP